MTTQFFGRIFRRYPIKTRRLLEVLPGFVSWTLVLSPIWASLLIPAQMAYFILLFDFYWLYKSFSLVFTAYLASNKIKHSERINWLEKARPLEHFDKVSHVLIIPNYRESSAKLMESI